MHKQKAVVTALSVAASLMLIAGTLAPVAYGAVTAADQCTLRADLDANEVTILAPKDPTYGGAISAGTVLTPAQTPNWGILCTYGVVKQISNILFLVVGILAVAAMAFAAFLFVTAAQNPEKHKEARNALLFAVVGIVVAVLAKIIPGIALGFLGVGGGA